MKAIRRLGFIKIMNDSFCMDYIQQLNTENLNIDCKPWSFLTYYFEITTHPDKFIAGILNLTDISIEQLSITNERMGKQPLNLYSDEQISKYLKREIPYPTCLEMEGVWRTGVKPIPIVLFLSFNDDGMFTDITIQVATGMGHVPSQLWQKLQTEIQIEIYGLYHPETMQLISTAETEEELRNKTKLANTVRRMVGKAPLQMGLMKASLDELNGKETPVFTDTEYRLLLSALTKEEIVCAEVDKSGSGKPLLPSIVSLQHKLHLIQYGHK